MDYFLTSGSIFSSRVDQRAIFSHVQPQDWELFLRSCFARNPTIWVQCAVRLRYRFHPSQRCSLTQADELEGEIEELEEELQQEEAEQAAGGG